MSLVGRFPSAKATAVTRKQPLNAEWLVISAQQSFFVRAIEVRLGRAAVGGESVRMAV